MINTLNREPATNTAVTAKSAVSAPSAGVALLGPTSTTLKIDGYLNQTLAGLNEVTEDQAFLVVVGWGFNVMSDAAKNPAVRDFFNSRKDELLKQATSARVKVDYQKIGDTVLREAVKNGLITRQQAEHTKGNAFKASQFDRRLTSLSAGASLTRESASAKISSAIGNFLSGKWDQEYLPIG